MAEPFLFSSKMLTVLPCNLAAISDMHSYILSSSKHDKTRVWAADEFEQCLHNNENLRPTVSRHHQAHSHNSYFDKS